MLKPGCFSIFQSSERHTRGSAMGLNLESALKLLTQYTNVWKWPMPESNILDNPQNFGVHIQLSKANIS